MSDATLDMKITLTADKETLQEIYNMLTCDPEADVPLAGDSIAEMVKQALKQAGVQKDVAVSFNCGYVIPNFTNSGGLSAREWMETDMPSEDLITPATEPSVKDFQD